MSKTTEPVLTKDDKRDDAIRLAFKQFWDQRSDMFKNYFPNYHLTEEIWYHATVNLIKKIEHLDEQNRTLQMVLMHDRELAAVANLKAELLQEKIDRQIAGQI